MLFANFRKVAAACRANGGHIALEWPRNCTYWKQRLVTRFLRQYELEFHDFDGCMYDLRSSALRTDGLLIKKPWRIASDISTFTYLRRKCDHSPDEHTRCAGSDTKMSEGYTNSLAAEIHTCFAVHAYSLSSGGYVPYLVDS